MSKYQQIIEFLSDGEWHTESELAQVTVFPERWVDELRYEQRVEVVDDGETTRVKLVAG